MKKAPEKEKSLLADYDYDEMEEHFNLSQKKLKYNLANIKYLDKASTNKFVLDIDFRNDPKGAETKFNDLVSQPFSFLEYNGAKFCVNLQLKDVYNIEANKTDIDVADFMPLEKLETLLEKAQEPVEIIREKIKSKTKFYRKKREKLEQEKKYLSFEVLKLKEKFSKIEKKVKNEKYIVFVGKRIVERIKNLKGKINQKTRQIRALDSKNHLNRPKKFFERACYLYLDKHLTNDILNDINKAFKPDELDYYKVIESLFVVLRTISENDNEYSSPVLLINTRDDKIGSTTNLDIKRIIAGHCFVNTVSVYYHAYLEISNAHKKRPKPKPSSAETKEPKTFETN